MQAVVDRIMRALALKHPLPEKDSGVDRQEITEFASELLEKYKTQLARRTFAANKP